MQRNRRINLKEAQTVQQLAAAAETALEELNQIVNQKSITNYTPKNPVENQIRLDETTGILYVWNTTTKQWVGYTPIA
jgi:hypothetical protein